MFYFKNSIEKFWYVNGTLTLISGGVILYFIIKMST